VVITKTKRKPTMPATTPTLDTPVALYPDHEKIDESYVQCPECGNANLFVCNTSNLAVWNYCPVHRFKWAIWDASSAPYGSIERQNDGQRRNELMLRSYVDRTGRDNPWT
jgi:hypothetical protein